MKALTASLKRSFFKRQARFRPVLRAVLVHPFCAGYATNVKVCDY